MIRTTISLLLAFLLGCGTSTGSLKEENLPSISTPDSALVEKIRTGSPEEKRDAAAGAATAKPEVALDLGELLGSDDYATRKNAEYALWNVARHTSRPGADEERSIVTDCCLEILQRSPAPSAHTQRILVDVLSVVATDPSQTTALSTLLSRSELKEIVTRALARIGTRTSEQILVAQFPDPSALSAVAGTTSSSTVDALLKYANDPSTETSRIARHALARSGDRRAERPLFLAWKGGASGASNDLLTLAAQFIDQGDRPQATRIFGYFLDSDADHLRTSATIGMSGIDTPAATAILIGQLGDSSPSVRAASQSGLVTRSGTTITRKLVEVFNQSSPTRRASALQVLADREGDAANAHIHQGLNDPELEVRLTAIGVASSRGNTSFEDVLRNRVSEATEIEEREAAFNSLLDIVRIHLATDNRTAALGTLHFLTEQEAEKPYLKRAVDRLASLGDPNSLPSLEALHQRANLRKPIAEARLVIAGNLIEPEPKRARFVLEMVFEESRDRNQRLRALEGLASLGVDTTDYSRSEGFLSDWNLLGTFPESTAEDLASLPFSLPLIPDDPIGSVEDKVEWQKFQTHDFEGRVDLGGLFEDNQGVTAYGLCSFEVPGGEGSLLLGSDDAIAVWLNGKLVHENFVSRACAADDDTVPVTFQNGENQLLVKVSQGGGDWAFCVRLTDGEARPLPPQKLD